MKDLFKEVIADAKNIRELALANAKASIEETLSPKIQSMISAKLQEIEDEELDESKTEKVEESNNSELEEDLDLSSILAELEQEKVEEAKDEDKEKVEEAKDEDEDKDEKSDDSDDDSKSEEEYVADLTVDDLRDIIKDIISAEISGGETPVDDSMEQPLDDETSVEEPSGSPEEEISIDENELEEVDLEELLAELDALGEVDSTKELDEAKDKDDEKEVKEALQTIENLRKELNEVNLLNAKLLYVNKIFKAKNLSESQKVKVLEAFDEANNVKEAKLIFESLNKALSTQAKTKTSIKENLGFASKPAGVAPKKQIVEVDNAISRMQFLAGIKK